METVCLNVMFTERRFHKNGHDFNESVCVSFDLLTPFGIRLSKCLWKSNHQIEEDWKQPPENWRKHAWVLPVLAICSIYVLIKRFFRNYPLSSLRTCLSFRIFWYQYYRLVCMVRRFLFNTDSEWFGGGLKTPQFPSPKRGYLHYPLDPQPSTLNYLSIPNFLIMLRNCCTVDL